VEISVLVDLSSGRARHRGPSPAAAQSCRRRTFLYSSIGADRHRRPEDMVWGASPSCANNATESIESDTSPDRLTAKSYAGLDIPGDIPTMSSNIVISIASPVAVVVEKSASRRASAKS
jgi:hypothetical protein